MRKLILLGGIIGMGHVVLSLSPADFMSPACRAEAEALQQRSQQISYDLMALGDSYTVTGRTRPGALDEVKQRQDRFVADLDAFDRQCK